MLKRPLRNPKPDAGSKLRDSDDFVSVARRLGASEDKEQFEAMLGKIARAKPVPKTAPAKRRKK